MSFRGRGGNRGSGSRGGGNRGGFRGGSRGGFRGGSDRKFDQGPPEEVVEFGVFSHECEGQLVVNATIEKVPFFNAPVYLKNITQIGKVDEILGAIQSYVVSVQLSDNYKASSFEKDQPLYIDPRKLLPLERFLPREPVPKEARKKRKSGDGNSDGNSFKRFKDDRGGGSFGRGRGRGNFSGGRGGNFSGGRGGGFNRNSDGGSFGFRGGNRGGGRGSSFGGRGAGRGAGRF